MAPADSTNAAAASSAAAAAIVTTARMIAFAPREKSSLRMGRWFAVALAGVAVGVGAAAVRYALSSSSNQRQHQHQRHGSSSAVEVEAEASSSSDAKDEEADEKVSKAKTAKAKAKAAVVPSQPKHAAPVRSKAQLELLSAVDAAAERDDAACTVRLDASFLRAADHVERSTLIKRVNNSDKLRMYALYKQATGGVCDAPKPRLLDGMAAHAKWSAWMDLGGMASDDAKTQYVELVEALAGGPIPTVGNGAEEGGDEEEEGGYEDEGEEGDGGFGGPVFSRPTMPFAESGRDSNGGGRSSQEGGAAGGSGGGVVVGAGGIGDGDGGGGGGGEAAAAAAGGGSHSGLDPLSDACKRGDAEALKRVTLLGPVDTGVRDDQGRTPLHWAADGAHTPVALALLQLGADVDAVDDEGYGARNIRS
jgi:acyl-CoA-binding protein